MPEQQFPCPHCEFPVIPPFYFCPNCGKKLKEPPYKGSVLTVLGLFLLSFFLPPLGIWPGIKLLMKKERSAQAVGLGAIFLTAVSILLTIWLSLNFISTFQAQLNQYQGL